MSTDRLGPIDPIEFSPSALPSPHRIAMFLDIDGTLLDIEPHPDDVIADTELIQLIDRVCRAAQGAVAFVSGRAITDIDRIFAPLRLPTAGLHGAEVRFPDGSRVTTAPGLLDPMRPALRRLVADNPGLLLEDKGATIAVHYRQRPDLAGLVESSVDAMGVSDPLSAIHGKCVVELKPSALDKGTAISTLLALPPFLGRVPVFIGDDTTDEEGFRLVNDRDGLSVRVGDSNTPSCAHMRLAEPAALRALLANFIDNHRRVDARS